VRKAARQPNVSPSAACSGRPTTEEAAIARRYRTHRTPTSTSHEARACHRERYAFQGGDAYGAEQLTTQERQVATRRRGGRPAERDRPQTGEQQASVPVAIGQGTDDEAQNRG
jgi:hypothetical protein